MEDVASRRIHPPELFVVFNMTINTFSGNNIYVKVQLLLLPPLLLVIHGAVATAKVDNILQTTMPRQFREDALIHREGGLSAEASCGGGILVLEFLRP